MEEGDVTDMYVWLERLAKNPYTDDELRPVVPGESISFCCTTACHHQPSM